MSDKGAGPVSIWVPGSDFKKTWYDAAERCSMTPSRFAIKAIDVFATEILAAISDDDEKPTDQELRRMVLALRGDGASLKWLKQLWREQGAEEAIETRTFAEVE